MSPDTIVFMFVWLLVATAIGKVLGLGSAIALIVFPPTVLYLAPLALRRVSGNSKGIEDWA